jgi:hypothetical protein
MKQWWQSKTIRYAIGKLAGLWGAGLSIQSNNAEVEKVKWVALIGGSLSIVGDIVLRTVTSTSIGSPKQPE